MSNNFTVKYLITCFEEESIEEKVKWICLEQSVELPEDLLPKHLNDHVVGKPLSITPFKENMYLARIEWPIKNVGTDITQFLNVLYGNISLKKGIKITHVDWHNLGGMFKGSRFGIDGIRKKFNIPHRPITCAVLKPMGLSAKELAEQAYELSAGGIDLIKDDHGLANQSYAPFEERIAKVVEAVKRAESETGNYARYFPNITTSGSKVHSHYKLASDLGAEGVMLLPHLCGYEVMHELAQSEIDLPIIAHPAFSGALVTEKNHGFTPAFLYGELYRALGADFTIYPNSSGRYSFTPDECLELNFAARTSGPPFKPIFPMPGGGMKVDTLQKWIANYGNDTAFLIGASLFQQEGGIRKATAELQTIVVNRNKE